jgi:hypothetical protein
MMRRLSFCLAFLMLAIWPAPDACAVELPIRKAGLWEMKIVRTGSPLPRTTMQHCTDNTVDHEMIGKHHSPATKPVCDSEIVQKTATGFSTESICNCGAVSEIFRSEFTGDFDSAYSVKSRSWMEGSRSPREKTVAVEAKWLGVCQPDQRPGDIMMVLPSGVKKFMNMDELKGLMPKPATK